MHNLFSVYFVSQPLHVSGMFNAHHPEVFTVYAQQLVRLMHFDWLLTWSAANQMYEFISWFSLKGVLHPGGILFGKR
jgi:hypothetical protein